MRRVIWALLCAVLLGCLWASPALAFSDVNSSHPYSAAISDLSGRSIINGYDDGSFGPEKPVWRQHFAKMIVLAMTLPCSETDVCTFEDVYPGFPGNLYPDHYIAVCAATNITQGTSPGRFSPDANISRAQVVTIVVRAVNQLRAGSLEAPPALYAGSLGSFSDTHAGFMRQAEYNGLLRGIEDFGSTWDPWASATRGEVAQLLYNLLGLLEGTTPPAPSGSLQVHFIDVGQGDSILIVAPDGQVALIDGGESGSGVLAYLRAKGITRINLMIATHPHTDHIGGLIDVLQALPVDEVVTNGQAQTTLTYERFLDAIAAARAVYTEVKRGDELTLGSLTFDVLHPEGPTGQNLNDQSVVVAAATRVR